MTPELRRTLLVDAVIVAVLVVLAFVLAPGVALVGIAALLVLILGAISFIFSEVRARRRHRRLAARRRAIATRQSGYGPPRAAGRPGPGRAGARAPNGPTVRRVPSARRAQARRKPLR
jgi:hypothetical protein